MGRAGTQPGERRRKGLTLAERRQERRRAILDAAREAFGSKSYLGTTIDDICRAAYVSARDFYAEFPNREALLMALGQELVQQIYEGMTQVEVEPGPDLIRRRTFARAAAVVHVLVDDPRVARVALIETVGVSPEVEGLRRQTHHLIADWMRGLFRDDVEAERIDEQRTELLSLALVGAVNELIIDWVTRPPDERCPIEELVDVVADLHMMVLHGPDR